MGYPIYHIEVDRSSGKVCSIHLGDSDLLEHRQLVTDREVIPLIDQKLVDEMRMQPENYAVRDNQIVPLPEEERTCTKLHVMDQMQTTSPFDFIAKRQEELNRLIAEQTDKIDEAIRINSRVAMAAEDLTPEVNQLRQSLEDAAKQFGQSTRVLEDSTKANRAAAAAMVEQNRAVIDLIKRVSEDIQALTKALTTQSKHWWT